MPKRNYPRSKKVGAAEVKSKYGNGLGPGKGEGSRGFSPTSELESPQDPNYKRPRPTGRRTSDPTKKTQPKRDQNKKGSLKWEY